MTNLQIKLQYHDKQAEALEHLQDPDVSIVLFGGGISGGKTRLAAIWVLTCAYMQPNTRWLIGRRTLSDLRHTSLVTLRVVASEMGILEEFDKGHNKAHNTITLSNGSVIILRQLDAREDDVALPALGSYELTGAVVDELSEVAEASVNDLIGRLRWNLPPWGGKLLLVSNPCKGWPFKRIYLPWRDKNLPKHTKYVHCVPADNPFNDTKYLATLVPELMGGQARYESLCLGNWEATEDDSQLVTESEVNDCFTFDNVGIDDKDRHVTWDPAYAGKDRSVVCLWRGMILEKVWIWRKVDSLKQIEDVKKIIAENHVQSRNVSIDANGSASLVAHFRGCVQHMAQAKALNGEMFNSLKDQLYYRLAQCIRERTIRFKAAGIQDQLTEEIIAHKAYRTDYDRPAQVLSKQEVSRFLGRSPDISDAVMQRMYWLLVRKKITVRAHPFQ